MSDWKMKRFWTQACVAQTDGGYRIELDGRPVHTPAKQLLVVPTKALATAIAAEWDAQVGTIDPRQMPFTRTANAAIDKVTPQKAEVADMLAAYGDSDLLCYRADNPSELVDRQAALWDPLLDWAATTLEVRLCLRVGVVHEKQDPRTVAQLTARVRELTVFELAAFHDLVSLSGSLILGFAAALEAYPAQELWEISRLDEIWQSEQWGKDEDAEAMAALKCAAFLHANHFFRLLKAA
ncbi:MAG: ATP12 family protein [Sulfitobacter sp.]